MGSIKPNLLQQCLYSSTFLQLLSNLRRDIEKLPEELTITNPFSFHLLQP
uniref:Uncharacterized protein n=1 Tax=Arundo donax TaxID=35708 RepID=A0A0A9BLM1_ARUDO